VNKADQRLSLKMTAIGNQVQNLTDKLLTPFYTHKINMELFFQDVAEKVKQKEKDIEEKRQEEYRKREVEEQRKQVIEEQKKREVEEKKKREVEEHKKRQVE
jgi:hypothetical protein